MQILTPMFEGNQLPTEEDEIVQETLVLIQRLIDAQKWEEAQDLGIKLNNAVPDDPQVLNYCGVTSFNAGHIDRAESFFLSLTDLAPNLSGAHANLAQVAIHRGDVPQAIERLGLACELAPENPRQLTTLGLWQLYFGQIEAGRTALSAVRALEPDNSLVNRVLQALAAGEAARNIPVDPKCVVLVSDNPRVREAKIGRALLGQGWTVYLISLSPTAEVDAQNFTGVVECSDPWDAVIKSSELRPAVYHCLAQMKYETTAAFLAAKPGIVVGDFYDQVDMLGDYLLSRQAVRHFDKALERSVMERADGHVCRSLEMQLAVRREKAFEVGQRIYFPDYAWGDIETLPKLSETDGELHAVYAGSIWIEKLFPELRGDGGYLWLGEVLTRNRVHMHVYPSGSAGRDFDEVYEHYRDLESRSDYFHLHRTISDGRSFLREISRYDLGLTVYKSIVDGDIPNFYNKWKLKFASSNKLADYVDTNVHLMINPECCVYGLARRLGLSVAADASIYKDEYWVALKDRLLQHRTDRESVIQRWSLHKNAPRLTRFYEELEHSQNASWSRQFA